MKKKQESQDFELEIDVLKLFKFFIHNGGIFLIFIIVSVSLTLINHKYSGESNAFFTGTSVIKLTSTERNFTARAKKGVDAEREARNSSVNLLMAAPMLFQGGKFDYPKLNLLKASIPGYIELISKKNVNPSSDDEKILKNKRHESFKVENFAALRTLKDISWVENNISGANGRNIAAKPNSVPVSNIKLFGEDYIYEAYEDIHITAKGGSKETVKAMLENTQTALGRLIQYSATKKWITDNIYSLILEKAQIKHLLAKSPGKEKDVQLRVKFLKNALEKNIEEKLPTSTEVYFKGAPQALIPLETRIFELKTLLEDLKRNKTKQKDRLKIIELEEKLFALYESNFAENFTKLSPPEFDVLREPVLQEFKNISFEEVETRAVLTGHLRSLKLVELMPKIFTQDPFISYTIFYEGYPRKIIWGASAGIFLAFTFISIRSISRNRGLIQDKKSTK